MCGRATLTTPGDELAELFRLEEIPELEPRYNIAPTQPIPLIKSRREGPRRVELVRWGLIPSWTIDPAFGTPLMVNARVESIDTRRAFAEPFKNRRCLVVADGFYEWQRQGKAKQAHHIHRADAKPFAFAGIWDRWTAKDGEVIESCAIVTREAVGDICLLHDRMPVILDASDHDAWVDPETSTERVRAILAKEPPELSLVAVSAYVNSASNEGPDCLRPDGGTTLSLF
jgi:putative SOS response-associated peptidase YedK